MEKDVLEMLEGLYSLVSEAWGVPLGNDKCIVERDKVLTTLDEIKAKIPIEIAEAKRLVAARDEFINNAKREGDSIKKLAEESARTMVEEQEIVKTATAKSRAMLEDAHMKSANMLDDAQKRSAEIKKVAWDYLDSSLRETENVVSNALNSVQGIRSKFANLSAPAPVPLQARVIEDNDQQFETPAELIDYDEDDDYNEQEYLD